MCECASIERNTRAHSQVNSIIRSTSHLYVDLSLSLSCSSLGAIWWRKKIPSSSQCPRWNSIVASALESGSRRRGLALQCRNRLFAPVSVRFVLWPPEWRHKKGGTTTNNWWISQTKNRLPLFLAGYIKMLFGHLFSWLSVAAFHFGTQWLVPLLINISAGMSV